MILCSDFDDTLRFPYDEAQNAANFAALKQWRAAGHLCILATNRGFGSVKANVPGSYQDYFDYLILDNGAKVVNRAGELLRATPFPLEVVAELIKIAQAAPSRPQVQYFDAVHDSPNSEPPTEATKVRFWFQQYGEAEALIDAVKEVNRRAFIWRFDKDPRYYDDEIKGCVACIDVTPVATDKAAALRWLLGQIDAPLDAATAIGDGENDYQMIHDFHGYAIAGSWVTEGHPELRTIGSVAELVADLQW